MMNDSEREREQGARVFHVNDSTWGLWIMRELRE